MSGRGFAGSGLVEGSSRARYELTPLKFVELERMQMGRGATNFGGEVDRSRGERSKSHQIIVSNDPLIT